ncbi:MAG: primosomal protein N' [Syntrophaceae bacterium]
MFVQVALNIRSERILTYSVPEKLRNITMLGKRALVPLGNRKAIGCILDVLDSCDVENPRDILDILDPEPLFGKQDLEFYRWAAEYYFYPPGKLISEIIPGGDGVESETYISFAGRSPEETELSPDQQKILSLLEKEGETPLEKLKSARVKGLKELLQQLEGLGIISVRERIKISAVRNKTELLVQLAAAGNENEGVRLTPSEEALAAYLEENGPKTMTGLKGRFANAAALVKRLEKKHVVRTAATEMIRTPEPSEFHEPPGRISQLTAEQESSLAEIKKGIAGGVFCPFLLHGVTGSGKTEVYLSAIEEALRKGGSAIYLVPEIALTPQLTERVRSRFPGVPIAVLHSSVSQAVRFDQWRLIKRGHTRIIVGARSAVFAPAPRLRLIVVDEEHDASYKQEDRMRYNARDLSILKAKQNSAAVVLGSATPAIQSYRAAQSGQLSYLALTKRIKDRPFPEISVIDMRDARDETGRVPVVSSVLNQAIGDTLGRGGQALVFLNRRGFNTFVHCRKCGHVFKCRNCSVSLVLHAGENTLKCHYCDYIEKIPDACPECGAAEIGKFGAGTEKLEQELASLFPSARIGRMDRDTTARKGSHSRILNEFGNKEIDILVGTQMIAKGHDYPNIHLVGVVSIDNALNLPDFRAAERSFQLLTQVAGRGGRGDVPGRVIIQTFNPGHYAVVHARDNDYKGFYEDEVNLRRGLGYPPFSRMVSLEITSPDKDRAKKGAQALGAAVREFLLRNAAAGIEALGPAEAPVAKVKNRHRWKLLLKGGNVRSLHRAVRDILSRVPEKGFEIRVDVDPVNFL